MNHGKKESKKQEKQRTMETLQSIRKHTPKNKTGMPEMRSRHILSRTQRQTLLWTMHVRRNEREMKPQPAYYLTTTLYTIIAVIGFFFMIFGLYQEKYFFALIMAATSYVAWDNTFCQSRKKYYCTKR